MRKIIISFCILLSALSLQAQSVSGIRIDGGNTPILVYFGGNQMCLPTTTCFVANLDRGYYTVEVYATRFTRPGDGFKLEADEDFWHPSALGDKWEVYSFLPKAEVEQRLKAMGVTEITEENLSLEDAFIGLTGKY